MPYSIGSELTPFGVAFYVAPYVNATIRVGTQDEKAHTIRVYA